MSLLMDALKRAETSKQEAQRAAAGAIGREAIPANADNLSLEPLAGASTDGKSLPDLAAHIDALDAELAITPAPAPRRPAPPPAQPVVSIELEPPLDSEEEKQAAARNAFAAKLAEKPSRRPMWLALGTLGLAAAGIGTYVFFQLQSMSSSTLAPAIRNATPVVARPASPTAVSPPAVPLTPAAPKDILSPNQASTATGQESASIFAPRSAGSAHEARPEPARRMAAADSPGAIPIRLTRTRPEPDVNAQAGYAKLQGNQLDAARHDYEQALKTDPNNVDTLLALAAIAQRQGRSADADRYQQRAIDADPRDPAAQAAVLGGASGGDQMANESRLKSALAAQPESGPLNFALGNLYARQGRWSEAQQVYFNAVAADADNPDYLFNLAISLDHLRQPKLAAQHYRLALDAAQRRPAAFDRERVRLRLAELGREN
ncbi:MAG: tetratricopeptide repeat protein [Azonexus sp.]